MAPSRKSREEDDDPYGMNEVDAFAAKSEKVLLENSTLGNRNNDDSDFENPDDEEEEVMRLDNDDSSDEDDQELDGAAAYKKVFGRNLENYEDDNEDADLIENENAWGETKNDYYGADDLDDEVTAKEIEKEALRQQKKHLEELNMDDYLDDDADEEWAHDVKEFDEGEFGQKSKAQSVTLADISKMDSDNKKDFLKTVVPEFLPLTKEMTTLTETLESLKSQEETEFSKIKVMALSSYLGTISAYFGILLNELKTNEDFTTMKNHPVMESILTSKEIWRQANELPNDFSEESNDAEEPEQELESANVDESDSENSNTSADSDIEVEKDSGESDSDEDVDLDDFEEYVTQSRLPSKTEDNISSNNADDFVEVEMTEAEEAEKKLRKKSLRFYTSKIDDQDNKKTDKFKGDDDIPYKERLFERQQRLLEEARKRGLRDSNGADLDDNDYDSDDKNASRAVKAQADIDYYKEIQMATKEKKDFRIQAHKQAKKAAREGKLLELAEEVGEDGKRAINYQILKNKGLTPKRKKDDRNARVKKRKKYEKAQKKLKSVRAVYSGAQSGPYGGEKTGIKKNLTRSVKFKN